MVTMATAIGHSRNASRLDAAGKWKWEQIKI